MPNHFVHFTLVGVHTQDFCKEIKSCWFLGSFTSTLSSPMTSLTSESKKPCLPPEWNGVSVCWLRLPKHCKTPTKWCLCAFSTLVLHCSTVWTPEIEISRTKPTCKCVILILSIFEEMFGSNNPDMNCSCPRMVEWGFLSLLEYLWE